MSDASIPVGTRCPPSGKSRCPYRGYFGSDPCETSLPYCRKFKEFLVQGKTKASQTKCAACLQAVETDSQEG